MALIKTSVGLPNTCHLCGEPMEGEWFARNTDDAISGRGGHQKCFVAAAKAASAKHMSEVVVVDDQGGGTDEEDKE